MNSRYTKSTIQLTAFHQKPISDFLMRLQLFCRKNRVSPGNYNIITKKTAKTKKETILRSPHVNKKARDQIQVTHVTNILSIDGFFNWKHFFFYLKKKGTSVLKFDYHYAYNQKLIYLKKSSFF